MWEGVAAMFHINYTLSEKWPAILHSFVFFSFLFFFFFRRVGEERGDQWGGGGGGGGGGGWGAPRKHIYWMIIWDVLSTLLKYSKLFVI